MDLETGLARLTTPSRADPHSVLVDLETGLAPLTTPSRADPRSVPVDLETGLAPLTMLSKDVPRSVPVDQETGHARHTTPSKDGPRSVPVDLETGHDRHTTPSRADLRSVLVDLETGHGHPITPSKDGLPSVPVDLETGLSRLITPSRDVLRSVPVGTTRGRDPVPRDAPAITKARVPRKAALGFTKEPASPRRVTTTTPVAEPRKVGPRQGPARSIGRRDPRRQPGHSRFVREKTPPPRVESLDSSPKHAGMDPRPCLRDRDTVVLAAPGSSVRDRSVLLAPPPA